MEKYMVSQKKQTQVDFLSKTLKDKSNFVLIKIDKTTHQNLENLRKELRKDNASLKVVKNTIFQKALNLASKNKTVYNELKKKFFPLREPTALITLDKDWNAGLKAFYNFIQKEKTLSFKFAHLDSALYSNEETTRIAQLPGREELVGKIIGSLKAPITKLVYSIKYNTNKLVYILQTKSKVKN